MKKVATVLMVLLLFVSLVFAANNDPAVQRVQKSRMLSSMLSKMESGESAILQKQTAPVVNNRIRLESMRKMSRQYAKPVSEKSGIVNSLKLKNSFWQGEQSKSVSNFSPALAKTTVFTDTVVIDFSTTDTIDYVAGDVFVFQIFSPNQVKLEFYVDDGDGIFDLLTDMLITDPGMDEEEIIVGDGDEIDETAAGDGVWQVTINTGQMDGPWWLGLQGMTVFVSALDMTTLGEGLAVANVLPLGTNTSISGTVMIEGDPVNEPASNIIIVAFPLMDMMGEDGPEFVFLTMTDIAGQYFIGIPDDMQGDFGIMAFDIAGNYPGYFPDPPFMELTVMGHIGTVDFMFRLGKETIYGCVTDESGNPVAGVPVIAQFEHDAPFVSEGSTDEYGNYELLVVPGFWEVEIDEDYLAGAYMAREHWLEVFENGGGSQANFVLYATDGTISGNVSYSDGSPAVGVEVFTGIWLDEEGDYYTETETDEFGNYTLKVSTALQNQPIYDWYSSYWVSAWVEDGIVIPDGYGEILADTTGLDFTVLVSDAGLSGVIYDNGTSQPLYDAQIHAYTDAPDGKTFDIWEWTWEDGSYNLPLFGGTPAEPVTWIIEVYWPWEWMPSVWDTLDAISGNYYTKDYYLTPPVTNGYFDGYVYNNNGVGISGARVELYGPDYFETWTDGSGYFVFHDLPFGMYNATAYAPEYEPNTIYDIYIGPEPVYREFWMGSAVGDIHVSGYVTDAATTVPIPNSIVLAFNWDAWEPFWFITDSTGYYEFHVRSGYYDFQVGANGYSAQFNYDIEIVADTTIDYALSPAVMAATLSGNVVDDMGVPLKKVSVYFESDTYMGWTDTDFNGHYDIELPTGYYWVIFEKQGFNNEERWIDFPSETIEDLLVMYPSTWVFGPNLIEVTDVLPDHGKKVRLTWKRAEGLQGAVEKYLIFRYMESVGPEPNIEELDKTKWDFVTTIDVHPEMEVYNKVVPTLYDKVDNNIYWSCYIVTAIGWNGEYWNSNIKAGWSEDNLPPEIPTGLTGTGGDGSIALSWEKVTSEKVKYYSIYRKTAASDFSIVGYSTVPEYTDAAVSQTEVYTYTVTATDFGLNESDRAVPLSLSATAIEEAIELPTEYALKPNYPNPFNPETTIEFALPKTSKVTLTIYNLMGQMIQELVNSEYSAGYQRVIWNGRDFNGNSVGSGVYIYTLKADNFSRTRKMILMR